MKTDGLFGGEREGRARFLLTVVVLLIVGGFAAHTYLNSASRRLARAMEAAAGLERDGRADQALTAYDQMIVEFGDTDARAELGPAAAGVVRVTAARVTEPVGTGSVEAIRRVVLRYQGLPAELRASPASDVLRGKLVAWTDQIGRRDLEARRASVRVLELAAEVAVADASTSARADRERGELAAALAGERPVEALRQYAALGDRKAAAPPMAAILSTFEAGSSLWLEAGDTVDLWLAAAGSHPAAAGFRTRLQEVRDRERDPARAPLLAGDDVEALAAAARSQPHDHGLAVALARAQRGAGKLDEAIATLTALGPLGRLTAEAQAVLGSLHAEAGKLEDAERVLAGLIRAELPAYQDAASRYERAAVAAEAALIDRARRGDLPADVTSELGAANPEKQKELVAAWLRRELEMDRHLASLAEEVGRRSHVVPASLSLGMVRLQAANAASGEARERLLAGAEAAFLSVRNQAEGQPDLHLGLGQVYYRLGRTADGERELDRMLAEKDPRIRLAVANIYRDLGIGLKATEIAEALWKGAEDAQVKSAAAALRSLLAQDLDEEETWLSRADQSDPFVRRGLMSLRAERKLREGDAAGADPLFAAVADEYGKNAARDGADANNAAVAEGRRFACTGDVRRLEKAADYMVQAYRLQPQSAIVAGNLVGAWHVLAMTRALGTWFDMRAVRPDHGDVIQLLAVMATGPERSLVRKRLTNDTAFGRAGELLRQWQILAPQDSRAHGTEQMIAEMLDDEARLLALRDRLGRVAVVPPAHIREWMSGAKDEVRRKELATSRARYERLLEATTSDKRARAALLFLLAKVLSIEAVLGDAAAALAERERLLAEAVSLFPAEGFERELAGARVDVAAMDMVARFPDARAVWDAKKRTHGGVLLAYAIAQASSGARDALRRHPAMLAARPAFERSMADRARPQHWAFAHVLGDADLETRAAAAIRASASRTLASAEIEASLSPESDSAREWLALVKQVLGP